eukprot:TRINITY_DN69891_c0_g1_i1.p1 TRINITY_DN69891_c0_g1~~TRINITY_DN69891_c0_g1_i1.p1  ORF type:complete len:243 (+),score=37.33 TRINITY_DN69891_c0_g1_i1:69-797(+)
MGTAVCCGTVGCARPAAALADAWRQRAAATGSAGLGEGAYGRLVYLRPGVVEADVWIVAAERRLAFVACGTSWANVIGFRAREILLRNGVQSSWIENEAALGTRFKLVVFDDDGKVWRADWEGVRRAVWTLYAGGVASKLESHWAAMHQVSWDELEAQAGASFSELDEREGRMMADKYLSAEDTLVNARRFLAAELSMNRLFSGTGYTVDERAEDGRGTAEFLAANRPLTSIPACQIIDISV